MPAPAPTLDAPVRSADAPGTLAYVSPQPLAVKQIVTRADGMEVATLEGPLVVFTDPSRPDLHGDYFDKSTDFGLLSDNGIAALPAYYQHGFDEHFGTKRIGPAEVYFAKADGTPVDSAADAFAVWASYQLELRTDYERHLLEMAEAGKMGQSSGAVAHLVKHVQVRTEDGHSAWRITDWPLGEASLTPTPAEPTTSAVPAAKLFADWQAKQVPAAPKAAPSTPEASTPEPTTTPHTAMSATAKTVEQAAPPQALAAGLSDAQRDEIKDLVSSSMSDAMKTFLEEQKPGAPSYPVNVSSTDTTKGAPAILNERGDSDEMQAYKYWLKTGRESAEFKASNATDMNIGTDEDGGFAVPTGHYNDIVTRRDERLLARSVGAMQIPGVGTTVNVPVDAEDDGEFVATNEAADSDLDAPAIGQVPMTLVTYSKRVVLSRELLNDETSNLLNFITRKVADGAAKTHNSLLITEVLANGTAFGTTASATALAAGELEQAIDDDDLYFYIENDTDACWIMRPSTFGPITSITGNDRLYAEQQQGSRANRSLLGYEVKHSNKVEAYGTASNKFALFGNFGNVGFRDGPQMQVLRDEYSLAVKRQVVFHYYFRTVYKVLQSEGVG